MHCTRINVSSSDKWDLYGCFWQQPTSVFFFNQCLRQHWKAERSRLVLCVLTVSHLENSSPPACCIINQKQNPLSSNVCEWWTISGPFCSVQGIPTNRRIMTDRLMAKYMLGIRDCLSSLPLPPSIQAGCDFLNRQDNVTSSILFFCSVCFHEY